MGIQKTSQEVRGEMRKKSALMLPNNPSASGMKPDAIRKTLVAPILDSEDSLLSELDRVVDEANEHIEDTVAAHEARNDNPHGVTADQVGLGNVDNTSDAEKPVSVAQQEALDGKVDKLVADGTDLVYGAKANGAQAGFWATPWVTDGALVMRDERGCFYVNEPTEGSHPVTRTFLEAIVSLLVGKQGNQTIGGDLSVGGDLYVAGSTYGTDMESLNVKDAVIVANADGVPLAGLSGYVIRAGGGKAYGILYDPAEDCVKIGLGTFDGKVFVYGTNEAQVLATRGEIVGGNIPMWDSEKHTFVDSGRRAEELATERYVKELYGDIDAALDELHAYAQALIGGDAV